VTTQPYFNTQLFEMEQIDIALFIYIVHS